MEPFHMHIAEYRNQMERGAVQKAYRGLMEYMMSLRAQFKNKYPDHFVSGSIYYGYMDMTYFSFTPKTLQNRKLKAAIVFLHETCRFEVWLGGHNKGVQSRYWKLFQQSGWDKYPVVPTIKGMDSIVEHILVRDPDFAQLDALTAQIERGTLAFVEEVEGFLRELDPLYPRRD